MKVMKDGDYQGGNNWATTVLNDHNKYRQQKGLGSVKLDPYVSECFPIDNWQPQQLQGVPRKWGSSLLLQSHSLGHPLNMLPQDSQKKFLRLRTGVTIELSIILCQLNQKAQARAEYVAKTGEFKHPRGGQKYKDGSPVLENLYQGKGIKNGRQLGTANAPTREWLTSSGHKARLDDKVVTKLGVGNAVGANGVKYTVGLYHPNTPNVRG